MEILANLPSFALKNQLSLVPPIPSPVFGGCKPGFGWLWPAVHERRWHQQLTMWGPDPHLARG